MAFPKQTVSLTISEIQPKAEYLEANSENMEIAYANWLKEQEFNKKAKSLAGTKQGSCVVAVRNFLGVGRDEIPSLAKNTEENSPTPTIGSVIITKESRYGHVGVVIDYNAETVKIYESNVPLGSGRAGIRTLKINDPRIKGYRVL